MLTGLLAYAKINLAYANNTKAKTNNKENATLYTEHYDNGDIRVTFTSKETYWDFLEVAAFTQNIWVVRIWDKGEFHLAKEFPQSRKEYYKIA